MRSTLIPIGNRWVRKFAVEATGFLRAKPAASSPAGGGTVGMALLAIATLASCDRPPEFLDPLPASPGLQAAPPRESGPVPTVSNGMQWGP
jgi:hypothetical protein